MLKILFLASNPSKTDPLNLGEEIQNILRKIRASAIEEIRIEQEWAVSPSDLITYLKLHQPTIVHFSGHGTTAGEIVLQDPDGSTVPVAPDILAKIFSVLKGKIRCVVLNACFTDRQAFAIKPFVNCVVGMRREVIDNAAIQFAGSFYDALASGMTIREAFTLGGAMMMTIAKDQGTVPDLLESSPRAADTDLLERPEIMCEFLLDKANKPRRSQENRDNYEVRAWIKNFPDDTFSIMYQLDTFHGRDEFSTITPSEVNFEIIFDCTFDFEIRATLWRNKHNGIGIRCRVVDALKRYYGIEPTLYVAKAITYIENNI